MTGGKTIAGYQKKKKKGRSNAKGEKSIKSKASVC